MTNEAGKVRRADEYEAVLSDENIRSVLADVDKRKQAAWMAVARGIEHATIEAFRAKHLPELNQQKAYDIQRDELMAANARVAAMTEVLKAIRDWPMHRSDEISLMASKALTTTAPQAADETTTAAPAAR